MLQCVMCLNCIMCSDELAGKKSPVIASKPEGCKLLDRWKSQLYDDCSSTTAFGVDTSKVADTLRVTATDTAVGKQA